MNGDALKTRIRNLSKEINIPPHLLMQNYFLERFLYRISISNYCDNFILKGGLLISSLIGVKNRTTMDIDTSLNKVNISETRVIEMIKEIIKINTDDNITYKLCDIKEIRKTDDYYRFRIRLDVKLEKMKQKIGIDISTADIITPRNIDYLYNSLLSDIVIKINTYNLETILSEKIETIITRGELNTRMRDFYDVYMLWKLKKEEIDFDILKRAVKNTFSNRKTLDLLDLRDDILDGIDESYSLKELWSRYTNKNKYANVIGFNDTIICLNEIFDEIF
ncbi:MAG: nucleotidyl transferase AbiEii/AbiGii toxin family protein [Bacillota bacterium]|nr:nucleotidyl transferase AbiEii/AbiGii toxin family protein [Bacillota bacterium]